MRGFVVRIALIAAALMSSAAFAQAQPPTVQAPPPAQGQAQGGDDDDQLVVDVTGGRRAARPIAGPYMPTPQATDTPAGNPGALGGQVAEIVSTDLRNSELFTPIGPSGLPNVSFPQVTAPDYGAFAPTGAQNL